MKWLIVNGDDFGASAGINNGIIEAHAHGILTSASLMVNGRAAVEAAMSARQFTSLSVGLHLELDPERPQHVRDQLRSQLARFVHLVSEPPSHVDSHHDIHRDPRVLPHVLAWADREGLPLRGYSMARHVSRFYGRWGGRSHPERIGISGFFELVDAEVSEGVTELSCHPGYVEPEFASSYLGERELELLTMCRPEVRQGLRDRDIHLIGFRDLPAFARVAVTGGIT